MERLQNQCQQITSRCVCTSSGWSVCTETLTSWGEGTSRGDGSVIQSPGYQVRSRSGSVSSWVPMSLLFLPLFLLTDSAAALCVRIPFVSWIRSQNPSGKCAEQELKAEQDDEELGKHQIFVTGILVFLLPGLKREKGWKVFLIGVKCFETSKILGSTSAISINNEMGFLEK